MPNEFDDLPEEGRGTLVQMEKPCVDCKKPWSMYQNEIEFYKHLIDTKGYKMPRRCPDCRRLKKEIKEGKHGPIPLPVIHGHLCKIMSQAKEGAYSLHDEVLVGDLKFIADALGVHVRQIKKDSDEQKTQTQSIS